MIQAPFLSQKMDNAFNQQQDLLFSRRYFNNFFAEIFADI